MKIKICGLKETEHALRAAALGADFLGFVFASSPRQVTPDRARDIIKKVPGAVSKVGVFVDEIPGRVNEIVEHCGLDLVQLHGRETPGDCREIKCPVIKGFRVRDAVSLAEMEQYGDAVEMFLVDAYVEGVAGGTGRVADWPLARQARRYGRIILAGGLSPENVCAAIEAVQPFGVDVSSGVESSAGVKDMKKIAAFIGQVRRRDNVYIT